LSLFPQYCFDDGADKKSIEKFGGGCLRELNSGSLGSFSLLDDS